MNMRVSVRLLLAAALFSAVTAGCQRWRKADASGASAAPGINQSFLGDDVDVDGHIARFESETREVAQNRAAIAAALGLKPGQSVADIGAGTGLFTEALHRAVEPDGSYFAVDISEPLLEHVRSRGAELGLDRMSIVVNGERDCGLLPASVDAAFICDTYHHFEFPIEMVASLYQAVRPGGQLVLVDFERIPGVSRPWLLDHVRAGKDVFIAEIESAGFVLEAELLQDTLDENYFLRFRRP